MKILYIKKIILYIDGFKVGEGPVIPHPTKDYIEYVQYVTWGADSGSSKVLFKDLNIQINFSDNRTNSKLLYVVDENTGTEYSLSDLGYNENHIYLPEDFIVGGESGDYPKCMLASDFQKILNRFNVLNRKHSLVEIEIMGSFVDYALNAVDAKDKDKHDIVKLASQEISLMRTWEFGSGTNIIYPYIVEWAYPGEVTPEFFEELEKEGWEVSY